MTTESPHILEIVPVVKPKDPYIFPFPLCLTSPNGLSEPIFENNIETEHEKMFSEQGIKIKALIAKCRFGDSSV